MNSLKDGPLFKLFKALAVRALSDIKRSASAIPARHVLNSTSNAILNNSRQPNLASQCLYKDRGSVACEVEDNLYLNIEANASNFPN